MITFNVHVSQASPKDRNPLLTRRTTRMARFPFPVHEEAGFTYVDEGPISDAPPVVLLHGMLGHLSNWTGTISRLPEDGFRVLVPVLPVYDMPIGDTSVPGLVEYTRRFLEAVEVDRCVVVGNSLGGHVALMFALTAPEAVHSLVLSGASGIYEVTIGTSMPRRYDPDYIREKAAITFYDARHASEELVAEMGEIVGNRGRVLRLIKMARSAKEEVLLHRLKDIHAPTLLIWGEDDEITPPDVAEDFHRHLPNAELRWIPQCGHAPMIEHPEIFNEILLDFLHRSVPGPAVVERNRA